MVSVNLPFYSPTGRNSGPRKRPDVDADTWIYALAFSRSKLSLCLAAEVATEPGCPHFGPRSAFSKLPASHKLVPSAPSGERLMSEGTWGQSQRPSPSPAPPLPAGGCKQELPSALNQQAVPSLAEARRPPISRYGNSLPREVIRLKI